jgi:hypothetical protein
MPGKPAFLRSCGGGLPGCASCSPAPQCRPRPRRRRLPGRETCLDWQDVTSYEGDGYTYARHTVVVGQTQRCTDTAGEHHYYTRAVLHHVSPDTWTKYPLEGIRVLIRRYTDDYGGCWCQDVYNSGVMGEPGSTTLSPLLEGAKFWQNIPPIAV